MKKEVAIILGTRPEAIKLIPVYLEMKKSDELHPVLISTGQHKEMLQQIFDFFEVKPDIDLKLMTNGQTLPMLTSRLLISLDEIIKGNVFSCIIVQGDTTTAFTAGLTAFYHRISVAHVEAGLRTGDNLSPYPEEVNRKMISTFAAFSFAPTKKAFDILINEGVDGVYNVGNTVVDSLQFCVKQLSVRESNYTAKFNLDTNKRIILVTGHRRESFGDGFQNICQAIRVLAKECKDAHFIYPVHLNPNVKSVVDKELSGITNVSLIEPLPYDELIFIMSKSFMILTDSGGIQEEAPSLNVPVVVMRETTEREEGVDVGCSVLAGTSCDGIVNSFRSIYFDEEKYNKMSSSQNPYGDGMTSSRIVKVLEEKL